MSVGFFSPTKKQGIRERSWCVEEKSWHGSDPNSHSSCFWVLLNWIPNRRNIKHKWLSTLQQCLLSLLVFQQVMETQSYEDQIGEKKCQDCRHRSELCFFPSHSGLLGHHWIPMTRDLSPSQDNLYPRSSWEGLLHKVSSVCSDLETVRSTEARPISAESLAPYAQCLPARTKDASSESRITPGGLSETSQSCSSHSE